MKTASWILLAVVGALMLLGSFASLYTAYATGAPDPLTPSIMLDDVTAGRPEVATAIRARRGPPPRSPPPTRCCSSPSCSDRTAAATPGAGGRCSPPRSPSAS